MNDSKGLSLWECLDQDAPDTLFLNRDGIILVRRDDGRPVKSVDEVVFQPQVLREVPKLAERFKHIFVIGSYRTDNCPTHQQQKEVDDYIVSRIEEMGGRVDGVYTEWNDPKLEHGVSGSPLLPLRVRRDYPTVNFAKSLLVGDSEADRMLAYNCGMRFLTLKSEFDIATLVDFGSIDSNLNMLRSVLLSEIEMLYKFMNSESRIRAIRLAARSMSNTLAIGGKLHLVLADDCGLAAASVARSFDFFHSADGTTLLDILVQGDDDATPAGLAARVRPHDVVVVFTVEGKWMELGELVATAQRCDAITVSVTGAKPMRADSADLLIKVPTTAASQVQTAFLLIIDMLKAKMQPRDARTMYGRASSVLRSN